VKGQGKLNRHIIFLKCADAVCQKLSKLAVLVETTACQSWHIFIKTQCRLSV